MKYLRNGKAIPEDEVQARINDGTIPKKINALTAKVESLIKVLRQDVKRGVFDDLTDEFSTFNLKAKIHYNIHVNGPNVGTVEFHSSEWLFKHELESRWQRIQKTRAFKRKPIPTYFDTLKKPQQK